MFVSQVDVQIKKKMRTALYRHAVTFRLCCTVYTVMLVSPLVWDRKNVLMAHCFILHYDDF